MTSPMKPYITKDEPFGPIDSTDIDLRDISALEKLFEQHNRIYKHLHQRPSIIMGRKGSGKTSYLRTVFFDKKYDYFTEIRTARGLVSEAEMEQRARAGPPADPRLRAEWRDVFEDVTWSLINTREFVWLP